MVIPPGALALEVDLPPETVLHFLGYPPGRRPPERTRALLEESLQTARKMARPRGACRKIEVSEASRVGLEPIEAGALVIGLVTVGAELEGEAARALQEGQATRALLLDAAADAAVEEAADRLGALLFGEDRPGPPSRVSCRVSPGYGKWPLSAQRSLFALLPHRELGVELLDSLLMVPRKTVSFAMWLGADARPLAGLSGCATCRLEHCRYRRVPPS